MIYYEMYNWTGAVREEKEFQHQLGRRLLAFGLMREHGIHYQPDMEAETSSGKPYFSAYPEIYFSIAHCDGLVLCQLDSVPCGADAERLRQKPERVARRYFPGVTSDREFFEAWTGAEAFGKMSGDGVFSILKQPQRYTGSKKNLQHMTINDEFIISICREVK